MITANSMLSFGFSNSNFQHVVEVDPKTVRTTRMQVNFVTENPNT